MRLGCGLALLVLFSSDLSGSDNQQNGLVLGIAGKWKDRGQAIHFGALLKPESQVSCEDSGALTVWFDNVRKPVPIPCTGPGTSRTFAALRPRDEGIGSKLRELVALRINQEPKTYIAAVSRGFGNAELEESVAVLQRGEVDLSQALAGAPAGTYGLVLMPISEDQADSAPLTVVWQPGSPARVSLPKAAPGLWKIALAAQDGALSSTAWILMVTPDRLPAASQQFQEARALVADWPGGTRAQASRTVLRAFLETLSQ